MNHPFTCMIAGPSGSGKTTLLRKIIENFRQTTDLKKINALWCYGVWQPIYEVDIPGITIEYVENLPEDPYEVKKKEINLIIIDDLMNEMKGDKILSKYFTKFSHHHGISIFFLVQNLFVQGSEMRNISLNCHYIIILKNVRDKSQIINFAKQFAPGKTREFINVYKDATKEPRGYLKLDLTPTAEDQLRIQTNIIPVQGLFSPIVYQIE